MIAISKIDISENSLRNRGSVLDILLLNKATSSNGNIIWATDSYEEKYGKDFAPKKQIRREQITGLNGKLIQPRAAKTKEEQKSRTKDKAEVFTPLKIVKEMNMAINWAGKNWPTSTENWVDYISELRLEITCGEAPFIAGRYNPTTNTGVVIEPHNRVGFLDYKLQEVGKYTNSKKEWLKNAEIALKSSYGYEWQGDNLLIARENVLQTIDDFYKDFCKNKLKLKSKQGFTDEQLEYFAEIVAWNIWQMDGLKYVKPMSCKQVFREPEPENKKQLSLLPVKKPKKIKIECEGCRLNDPSKHTGQQAFIKDWTRGGKNGRNIRFVNILNEQ
ncbi:restriction endonuclease subunit M [Candidatus Saccharibacteria bacterium]|nr:restriction endonuclease subunit M [Candidatus Saccharibacteria bacterium]